MAVDPKSLIGLVVDDKYELLSLAGSGGMGSVFKARQAGIERIVALKLLHQSMLQDPDAMARFEREAKASSGLRHPNIAAFLSYGVWNDVVPFIVMEHIEGKSLAELISAEQKITWQRSLKIIIQICNAMEHAHKNGIVHRDLKPSNILLVEKPQPEFVKVVDFGLAIILAPDGQQVQKLTQTGLLVGSAQYMSPELCRGQKADSRSDIYSLGCILYECLCGEPPHKADTAIGLMHKHSTEMVIAPSNKYPDRLPDGMDEVVLKSLAKEPAERYQSMSAFRQDLEVLLSETESESKQEISAVSELRKNTNRDFSKSSPMRLRLLLGTIALVLAISVVLVIKQNTLKNTKTVMAQLDNKFSSSPKKTVGTYLERANEYERSGKYKEAINECSNAIKINPQNALAYSIRGNAFTRLSQYPEAIDDLNRAISLDPKKATVLNYFNRGDAHNQLKHYQEAIDDLTKAINLNRSNATTWMYFNRAFAFSAMQQYQQAVDDFSRTISLDSKNSMFYIHRGILYGKLGQLKNEINDLNIAIKIDPKNAASYQHRADSYAGLGQSKKADEDYSKAISLLPKNADYYARCGERCRRHNQYKEALVFYDKALSLAPNKATYLTVRAGTYKHLEQYKNAIVDCNKAISLDPKDVTNYIIRAGTYTKLKQFLNAIDDYTKAISLDPKNQGLYLARANVYEVLGNTSLAEKDRAIGKTGQ